MAPLDDRYRIDGVEEIDSPALFVFPQLIWENIAAALRLTQTPAGNCLRPHIKTVKCYEIAMMAVTMGITRFKCSTVSEGELLAAARAREVLINYQLSAVKAKRWPKRRRAYPNIDFATLVDNPVSARLASDLAEDRVWPVYIDVNPGMNRTGIVPAGVPALYDELLKLPHVEVRGLHAYDGHLHDHDRERRRARAAGAYALVDNLRQRLQAEHGTGLEIIMGGSPSFPFYVGKPNTTVSPGTFYL